MVGGALASSSVDPPCALAGGSGGAMALLSAYLGSSLVHFDSSLADPGWMLAVILLGGLNVLFINIKFNSFQLEAGGLLIKKSLNYGVFS